MQALPAPGLGMLTATLRVGATARVGQEEGDDAKEACNLLPFCHCCMMMHAVAATLRSREVESMRVRGRWCGISARPGACSSFHTRTRLPRRLLLRSSIDALMRTTLRIVAIVPAARRKSSRRRRSWSWKRRRRSRISSPTSSILAAAMLPWSVHARRRNGPAARVPRIAASVPRLLLRHAVGPPHTTTPGPARLAAPTAGA